MHTTTHPTNPSTSRHLRVVAAAGLLAPLALLAACGDDDEDAQTPTTLAESAWRSTVDELCTDHNAAIGSIIGPLFAAGPPADDAAQAALDEIVDRTRAITDQIDELAEPSRLTIHVAALVSALDAGSDQAEALGGPAFFADKPLDPFRPAADIADDMGLSACASS